MELTREQLDMKVTILQMTLGIIARNERSCPDIETARQMANDALSKVDEHVTHEPTDIFDAYGLGDGDTVIDATGPEVRTTTVAAVREDLAG